tara:strand:- start:44 stop:586 length:543 start_codon:yes stop_codon:yes gene_type:complete
MSTLIATNGNITNVNTGTIKDSTGNTTAMTVDSSGRVLMPARVCWMFTSSGGFTIAGGSETAKVNWDTQVVNIGSAWNGSNREFTAPVAGTYRISWGMEFQDGDNARYVASRIYKGGSNIGSVHRQNNPTAQGGNQYDGVDHTHLYTFTQGEKWWIVPQSSSTINITGGYGTYCCGELIG